MSSPLRLERWLACQEPSDYAPYTKPIRLSRDCQGKWGSSNDMIDVGLRLRHAIDRFLKKEAKYSERESTRDAKQIQGFYRIRFTDDDWSQLAFVQNALSVFRHISNSLGMSREPLLPTAWAVFNDIFDHFTMLRRNIRLHVTEGSLWTNDLLTAINAAEEKLRDYYSATTSLKRGLLYNVGTILDPTAKLSVYLVRTCCL